ncbi:MAG: hypothetical protein NT055_01780 [Nitrospirae bacterium]|nr:hypothetical protein [Nitrospirota bacterium]
MSEKVPEVRRYEEICKNPSATEEEKERAKLIMEILKKLSFDRISLSYVVNKIELAAQFQM